MEAAYGGDGALIFFGFNFIRISKTNRQSDLFSRTASLLLANFANYRCTTYAGFHSVFTSEPVQFTQRTRWQFPLFLSGTTVDGNDPGRTPKERPQSPRTFALLLIKRATALLTPQLTTIIKHNNRHRIHLIKSSFILRHHRAHYSLSLSLSSPPPPASLHPLLYAAAFSL